MIVPPVSYPDRRSVAVRCHRHVAMPAKLGKQEEDMQAGSRDHTALTIYNNDFQNLQFISFGINYQNTTH